MSSEPYEPGWYWYRFDDQHVWSIMQVEQMKNYLVCRSVTDNCNYPENYPGDWIQIEEPTGAAGR